MSGEQSPPRTRVVGIKLSEESLVPIVILKASGDQANQLLDDAKHAGGVPVVRAPSLASQLYRIPLDHAVTPDLFPMMAALLAHVIHVDKQRQEKVTR